MNDDLELRGRGRRWVIGAIVAAFLASASGVLLLVFGGFPSDAPRRPGGQASAQAPVVTTFIVDGMMKSRSGAT